MTSRPEAGASAGAAATAPAASATVFGVNAVPGTKPSCSTRRQNFPKLAKSTPVESVSVPNVPAARPSQFALQKSRTISIGVLVSPASAAITSCAERHS